jgi:hypothetical protein
VAGQDVKTLRRWLVPALPEDPDDVASVLEEAAVEVDEGPQLPGRVAGALLQLRDRLGLAIWLLGTGVRLARR